MEDTRLVRFHCLRCYGKELIEGVWLLERCNKLKAQHPAGSLSGVNGPSNDTICPRGAFVVATAPRFNTAAESAQHASKLSPVVTPTARDASTQHFRITTPRANAIVPSAVIQVFGVGADPTAAIEIQVLRTSGICKMGRSASTRTGLGHSAPFI